MFKNYTVPVPSIKGKIYNKKTKLKNGSVSIYVEYEISRTYDKKRKNTSTRRTTIGTRDPDHDDRMFPNDNYYKYIPDAQIPEELINAKRSGCLKAGSYLIIKKIIEDYKLDELLKLSIGEKNVGLFLDLAAYAITCENNAGQYYPDYAYNHPLFTDNMRIYSDSTVSDFFQKLTIDQRIKFVELWTNRRGKQDKIYLSYDSTNKKSQVGDLEIVELGELKTGETAPIFNYSLVYDHDNREPLLYEKYPGSINDVSQLESLLKKIHGYGYHNICMILDRGYFSRNNIRYMDQNDISFIMMVKGQKALVNKLVFENKGKFEDKISCHIQKFDINGMTVKGRLYESDQRDRYFHLFYSPERYASERAKLMSSLAKMEKALEKYIGTEQVFSEAYHHYYELYYKEETEEIVNKKTGETETVKKNKLYAYVAKAEVIDEETQLCGYFAIITSDEMSAREAYLRYKGRDPEEKLFRGDKSYLGNKSIRVYSDESTESKIFIEFIALIIRNKIYLTLLDEMNRSDTRPNYMTVPAALKELNKIELLRLPDGLYRMDHAISATQKAILKAFGITPAWAKDSVESIGKKVTEYDRKRNNSKAS